MVTNSPVFHARANRAAPMLTGGGLTISNSSTAVAVTEPPGFVTSGARTGANNVNVKVFAGTSRVTYNTPISAS